MSRDVLVTGGSGGIGFAVAQAFVDAGDTVTITGRDPRRLEAAGSRLGARTVVADATDVEALEALPRLFADGIDVVVNNAGGFAGPPLGADASLEQHEDHWLANLRANLLGAVLTVTSVEHLIRSGGSVVSIGSIGAEYAANAYSTAKAGIVSNLDFSNPIAPGDQITNPFYSRDHTPVFVFLGRMTGRYSKEEASRLVEQAGGRVDENISVNADFVVVGEKDDPEGPELTESDTYKLAVEFGCDILSVRDLETLLRL